MTFKKLNKSETPVEPSCIIDICGTDTGCWIDNGKCIIVDYCRTADYN